MCLASNLCILSLLLLRGSSKMLNITEGYYSKATPSPSLEAATPHFKATRGFFHKARMEHLSIIEGQNLDLHCPTAGNNPSVAEWKNPLGFVIFFNSWRGLRDRRYKLLSSSEDGLSVRLSNVTTHDEGIYTCIQYSKQTRRKEVKVTVLAIPSQPVLEAERIGGRGKKEKMVFRCSTWGSKPAPKITWLLDNGIELAGNTKHQLGDKKYNTTSTLSVFTFAQETSLTCVIRHRGLGEGRLTGTLQLKHTRSDKILDATQATSSTQALPSSTGATTADSNTTIGATTADSNTTIGATTTDSSTTNESSYKTLNATERKSVTQIAYLQSSTSTLNPQTKNGNTDLSFEAIERKPSVIFPILVAILLFLLFVIVLLLVVKLQKSHRKWKIENEAAEQTWESSRPRPNEDNHGQQINKHVPWNISKKCIKSCTRIAKHSEESQDSSVFEKQLPCVKETDL